MTKEELAILKAWLAEELGDEATATTVIICGIEDTDTPAPKPVQPDLLGDAA